jgi:GDP-4-dehydro-6-deoxy-D-mannose reductase
VVPVREVLAGGAPARVVLARVVLAAGQPVKALITGAGGFVGGYLTTHLEDQGDEVVGLDQDVDITDLDAIREAIVGAAPEAVYHLAAASNVGSSWAAPVEVLRVNAEGTLNVLLACEAAGVDRVLAIGSAEEYGKVDPADLPLSESAPLRPVTPYGASKVASGFLALQAFLGRGLGVVRVRPFNHLGPSQSGRFVASALAEQVARNEHLGHDVVLAGDLSPRRDFTDVRDVVRAYRLLVTAGEPGEVYNVCSGVDVAISEVAEHLIGRADRPMRIELDPERLRPVELPVLRGDPSKLRAVTGWEPAIPLGDTLDELLAWWRERVAAGD